LSIYKILKKISGNRYSVNLAGNEVAAWQQWRVSSVAGTRAATAKLNKTSDEPSPPLRQTACCELGGEGQQKNTLNILQNCIRELTKSNEFSAKVSTVAKQKVP